MNADVVNVVFDIDGVLNCTSAESLDGVAFFKEKGLVLTAIKTHYIYPGVVELMRALFKRDDVRVSFYSSGDVSRGPVFVKELFKHVFPFGRDTSNICILSKEDLVMNSRDAQKLYEVSWGNQSKDLKKVVRDGDSLENAILIEDNTSYAAPGQEKNVLYVQETHASHYRSLENKVEIDGKSPVKCTFTKKEEYIRDLPTKRIVVHQLENCFHVYFRDAKTGEQRKEIIEEGHPLYEKLLMEDERYYTLDYDHLELSNELRQFVAEKGGLSHKVCSHKANRIFYLAGLLFKALDGPRPVTQCLFKHQIKENKAKFQEAIRDDRLYQLGLEKLKQINPNLGFITPQTYVRIIKFPRSVREDAELQAFRDNEDRGCCIC